MNTLDILTRARDLISDPATWSCEDGYGDTTHRTLCATGAVAVAAGGQWGWGPASVGCNTGLAMRAIEALAQSIGVTRQDEVEVYNDAGTHARTLAMFDRAIADERARQQEQTAGVTRAFAPTPTAVPA